MAMIETEVKGAIQIASDSAPLLKFYGGTLVALTLVIGRLVWKAKAQDKINDKQEVVNKQVIENSITIALLKQAREDDRTLLKEMRDDIKEILKGK